MCVCCPLSAACRCEQEQGLARICTFLHMHVYLCLCEYERRLYHASAAGSTWLCCHHSGSCCECPCRLAGMGRPSLWLTQAKRGFLHIFCHTIWALVSVAAPLRTHLAARGADGHLLFATSWWTEKTTTNRACSLTLCSAYFAAHSEDSNNI